MDSKYLVDGANFVISKMHFNSEGNFYITLGLPKNTTQDEIRERWKRLMLLYHPDKQLGEEEWVSERAKKVNEAYSTLKDEDKRQAYDLKLIEKSAHHHFVAQPMAKGVPSRAPKLRTTDSLAWGKKKKYISRVILGLYVLAALILFTQIYFQNNSEVLESALTTKPLKQADPPPESAEKKVSENITPVHLLPHQRAEEASGQQQTLPGLPSSLKIAGDQATSEASNKLKGSPTDQESQQDKVNAARGASFNKTKQLPAVNNLWRKPESGQESVPKASVYALKENPEARQGTKKTELLPQNNEIKASAVKTVHNQNLIGLTKEEVEGFIRLYSSLYLKNDVRTFMSLFSESAVENNSLHYNEIRAAYAETFSEKINYYKINNLTIIINGQTAYVSGGYDLSRYTSALDRWMRYSGKIHWEIARENNSLKIIRMNYD